MATFITPPRPMVTNLVPFNGTVYQITAPVNSSAFSLSSNSVRMQHAVSVGRSIFGPSASSLWGVSEEDQKKAQEILEKSPKAPSNNTVSASLQLGGELLGGVSSRIALPKLLATPEDNKGDGKVANTPIENNSSSDTQAVVDKDFETLFKYSPNYVYIVSPNGIILDVNDKALQELGYKKEELIGLPLIELYALESLPKVQELFLKWKETGHLHDEELTVLTKSGEKRIVLLNASSIKSADGKVVHSISIQTDITERRQMEERIIQSEKIESIGRLAGGVAHDVNNALVPVMVLGKLILRDALADELVAKVTIERAETIIAASERIKDTVSKITAFSRSRYTPERLDVNSILSRLVEDISKGITSPVPIDIKFLGHTTQWVYFDRGQLQQVVQNLVLNAVDAMPDGGRVVVSTDDIDDTYLRISVSDNGEGITKDKIRKIFEPFFTTKEKGSGWGLWVVQELVKTYGGYVNLETTPGKGTTFYVYLPSIAPAKEASDVWMAQTEKREGTILIVDDEQVVRRVTAELLRSSGYTVIEASSAKEALGVLGAGYKVDAIVTDYLMGRGQNGLEFSQFLRRQGHNMAIFLTSGYMPDADVERKLEEAGVGFIAKPFGTDLKDIIWNFMKNWKKDKT